MTGWRYRQRHDFFNRITPKTLTRKEANPIDNLRPGVYTRYSVTQTIADTAIKGVGLICAGTTAVSQPAVAIITSMTQAQTVFGADSVAATLIAAILANAPATIYTVAVTADSLPQYQAAADLLFSLEKPYYLVTDSRDSAFFSYVKEKLADSTKVFLTSCEENPVQLAQELNCSRILIGYPKLSNAAGTVNLTSAVLAGILARQASPISNLVYEEVAGGFTLSEELSEEEKNTLMAGGVTIFEQGSLFPVVIRGITTQTKNELGEPDTRYRNVSVITTLDEVVLSLQALLKKRIVGNARLSLGAIGSLVECELIDKRESGLLSSYEKPVVTVSESDSSVCLIQLAFTVAQGVTQVFLTACVTI